MAEDLPPLPAGGVEAPRVGPVPAESPVPPASSSPNAAPASSPKPAKKPQPPSPQPLPQTARITDWPRIMRHSAVVALMIIVGAVAVGLVRRGTTPETEGAGRLPAVPVVVEELAVGSSADGNFNDLVGRVVAGVMTPSGDFVGRGGLDGTTIRLVRGLSGSSFVSTETDRDGNYRITSAPPGAYQIEVEVPLGYQLTSEPPTVVLGSAEDFVRRDFEAVPVPNSIAGRLYRDVNENSVFDAGDEPRFDSEVWLLDGDAELLDVVLTDSAGFYEFDGIDPGDYMISTGQGEQAPLLQITDRDVPLARKLVQLGTTAVFTVR